MAAEITDTELFAMVDRFIDLANQLVTAEQMPVGRVSAALTYAAARFNAHEASRQLPDIVAGKAETMAWFIERYGHMLEVNFDEHAAMRAQQAD